MPHEITKEFWKNCHFENMTAGFLWMCQNTLRWSTPEKMHFQHWNFSFSPILLSNSYCSDNMWSVLYLNDFFIIFWDHNISKRQLLLSWINISMTNQAYFSSKWILTPQKETSCHIFKMVTFSKDYCLICFEASCTRKVRQV